MKQMILSDGGQVAKKLGTKWLISNNIKSLGVSDFDLLKDGIVYGANEFLVSGYISPKIKERKLGNKIAEEFSIHVLGEIGLRFAYEYFMGGDKTTFVQKIKDASLVQGICEFTNTLIEKM